MRESESIELRLYGLDNAAIAVAEAGNGSAAGSVEIALAGAIDDIDAITLHCERQIGLAVTWKNITHGSSVGCTQRRSSRIPHGARMNCPRILTASNIDVNFEIVQRQGAIVFDKCDSDRLADTIAEGG